MSEDNSVGPGVAQLLEANDAFSEMEGEGTESTPSAAGLPDSYTMIMDVMKASIKLAITEAIQQTSLFRQQEVQQRGAELEHNTTRSIRHILYDA